MDRALRSIPDHEPALPKLPPWSLLDASSAKELLMASHLAILSRGDNIEAELGIVLSGVLAVERTLSDGRRVLSELYHEGELVNLSQSKRAHDGRVVALRPSEFLILDGAGFDVCMDRHPAIAEAMKTQLIRRHAKLRDHIIDLAAKTPFEKVASVLFEFKHWPQSGGGADQGQKVKIPIQRIDIADYIGVKPETLSRVIRRLERECLISILAQDQILMADVPSMRQIANGGRPRQSNRRT